jgi:putative membrane protein
VRVVHHVALTSLVAPLLAWAAAPPPDPARRPANLSLWTGTHLVLLWIWHAPPAYAAALGHDGLFWAMQLSLLGSATGFWRAVRQAALPAAVGGLLVGMIGMGMLGAVIALAATPLYLPHLATTAAWGLGPLADQQLAGLIMWAPGALPYPAIALWLLARHFGAVPGAGAQSSRRTWA